MAKYRAYQTREGFTVYYPGDIPVEEAAADIERRRQSGDLRPESPPGTPIGPPIEQFGPESQTQAPGRPLEVNMQPYPPVQEFEEEVPQPQMYEEAEQGPPIGILKGDVQPQLAGNDLAAARIGAGLQGALFEGGDEVLGFGQAALDELTGSEPGQPIGAGPKQGQQPTGFWSKYNYYRDRARALDERLLGERPLEGYGLRIGTGIASGLGALPKLSKMAIERVAPEMGKRLAASKIVPQAGATTTKAAATLGDKAVDSAVQGAIAGGMAGFNSGQTNDPEADLLTDASSRLLSGLTGAGVGGAIGGVLPPALAAAGGGARFLGQAAFPSFVNPQKRALDALAQGIGDDLTVSPQMGPNSPGPVQAMLPAGQAVQDVTLADVSPNVRNMLGHVARSGRQGGTEASEFLAKRQEGDPVAGEAGGGMWTQMLRHVREVIGSTNPNELVRTLAKARAKAAKPAYNKAFSHPDPTIPELNEMLQSDRVRAGARLGAKIMKDLGELPEDFQLPKIDDETPSLPLKVWHVVKMGLDAQHQALMKNGKRLEAAGVNSRRERLLEYLDEATNGDYGKARREYAGYSSMMEAVEQGQDLFNIDISDLSDLMAQYSKSPGMQQLFVAGVGKALVDKITRKGIDANSAWIMYKSPDVQMRLGLALGPGQYQNFIKRCMAESEKFKAFMELKGSQTDMRGNIGEMVEEAIAGGGSPEAIIASASGISGGGFQSLVRPIWGWFTQNSPRGLHQSVKDEIAKMATETDPVKQQKIVDGIFAAANRVLARQRRQRLARGARAGGTSMAATSLAQDSYPDNSEVPPAGFKQAADGAWYGPDPKRPGAYLKWTPE